MKKLRIPRIYTASTLHLSVSTDLEAKALKHIKDVLRMTVGNEIVLFNGDGYDYHATISELSKKCLRVDILTKQQVSNESSLSIHLLQPLCRSDKMDWCLQKATELGVNTITPFISSRVNISIAANRIEKKMAHWNSVIQSACEQSARAIIPHLNTPVTYSSAVSNFPSSTIKILASPLADKETFKRVQSSSECICAIGPEGGFDEHEITLAENEGFTPILMGPRVLRLETAVISALSLCQSHWGDFN